MQLKWELWEWECFVTPYTIISHLDTPWLRKTCKFCYDTQHNLTGIRTHFTKWLIRMNLYNLIGMFECDYASDVRGRGFSIVIL